MTKIATLPMRAVLAVEGEDRVAFLQGLVSNDVAEAAPGRVVWAALLTPQGKWLADFFILSDGDRLLLDCERAQLPGLRQRLVRYRLRSRVSLTETQLHVNVLWDGDPVTADVVPQGNGDQGPGNQAPGNQAPGNQAIVGPDPRLPGAGWRVLSIDPIPANATEAEWDLHRLALGLPDGSRDMEAEKSVLLEAGFDELHGVSWTKGCYMGQELTARTKYRGLVKRRLVPVRIDGAAPEPGSAILCDGKEVGAMRSANGQLGMALLRLDALEGALISGAASITPVVPSWMHPEQFTRANTARA